MNRLILFFLLILLLPCSLVIAQENPWEDLLRKEVEVENPVYKPVVGFGAGIISFYGDVRNNHLTPMNGMPGYKINVATFLDNKRYFKANFFLITGKLTGNQRSLTDSARNLNFQSDMISFGINMQYSFGHLLKKNSIVVPFISVGLENIQFNSKGDLFDAEDQRYYYWNDGSIRNMSQPNATATVMQRDFRYETDLRKQNMFGYGDYSQNTFAIPVDAGLDFNVSNRVTMRLGTSLHFTLSDYFDNLSGSDNIYNGVNYGGNSAKDMFTYTYVTFHLDLFSDAKTIIVEKLFADVEFDYAFYGDEDYDMVFDGWDNCPGTPKGVEVDSLGCPFDADDDGVADYLDKQINSRQNAVVNSNGVEISDDEVLAALSLESIRHSEVDLYKMTNLGYAGRKGKAIIPQKFVFLDVDKDAYISFDEVLNAIDDFFDFETSLSVQDIYELNDFFFSQ
jgi:hypothetical protein